MLKNTIKYAFALLGIFLLAACDKTYEKIEDIDEAKIQDYIKKNNFTMQKDPAGFYYQVVKEGTGDVLLNKDSILYNFNIKSMSGTIYQDTIADGNVGKYLGYVSPEAYRKALLTVKRGGSVRVILPSYLAFGKEGSGNIPSNEVIVSEITTYPYKKQWELDDVRILAFLKKNNITATKHSSRVYYQVIKEGTGSDVIDLNSTLVLNYTGRLLNGTTFDSSNSGTFSSTLTTLIRGWQKVVPLFKKGAKIRIFIPSDLAYGTTGSGSTIPQNSVLDFDIEIVNVTN
ncbi:MAG: FKBP-type peptidyl-prolyl cis-trans isomerase [Sphingobacteriaceae bacterium]|nr:FKBP-type peptidyl-prolyl cis-trans isomerase [Sphingobacteriaceae bacterium]